MRSQLTLLISAFTLALFGCDRTPPAPAIKPTTCAFSQHNEGMRGMTEARTAVSIAFDQGGRTGDPHFEKLDALFQEWTTLNCKLDDGRPKMNFFLSGIGETIKYANSWNEALGKVQLLKKAHPSAAYPLLAEAQYWNEYAWNARGNGFASSVTPANMKLFKQRLAIAEKILMDNKAAVSTLPDWYALMISVQSLLDRPVAQRDEIFLEGATRFKTFLPLYIAQRNLLEPKWGGSWEDVDKFIQWAVTNTNDTEGESMYARLYYGVHDNLQEDHDFFSETRVDWEQLKKGYEDLIQLNAKSRYLLNEFASMACEANDAETYRALREKIGDDVVGDPWTAKYTVVLCDARFKVPQSNTL